MDKSTIKKYLFPIGIFVIVSFAFATAYNGIGGNFWSGVLFASIGQFILFFLFSLTLEQLVANRNARQLVEMQTAAIDRAVANQSLDIECAYCHIVNKVPIILAKENVFECFSCKNKNVVQMQFFAARVTMPVARKVETELAEKGLPDEESQDNE